MLRPDPGSHHGLGMDEKGQRSQIGWKKQCRCLALVFEEAEVLPCFLAAMTLTTSEHWLSFTVLSYHPGLESSFSSPSPEGIYRLRRRT